MLPAAGNIVLRHLLQARGNKKQQATTTTTTTQAEEEAEESSEVEVVGTKMVEDDDESATTLASSLAATQQSMLDKSKENIQMVGNKINEYSKIMKSEFHPPVITPLFTSQWRRLLPEAYKCTLKWTSSSSSFRVDKS